MQNMHVEYGFKGKAKWRQIWNLLTISKIKTILTEQDILSIWEQYHDQKVKEQLHRQQKTQ